jgi:hypothetical protein
LDLITLANNIINAATSIDAGRKGFATKGKAEEGRINYEDGIESAMSAFQQAQATADPQTIILAEYTFLSQEFEFCDKFDKESLSSLTQAIQSFDDAFQVLKIVEKPEYKIADIAIPHHKDYRVGGGYPKDSFHVACGSHKTRLKNILRSPGIDSIEKALLKQRLVNLSAGQSGYVEKQKKALLVNN